MTQTPEPPGLVALLWDYIENGESSYGHDFFELRDMVRVHGGGPSVDLLAVARRHRHLLSELHAGNAFSKDQLWRRLEETEPAMRKADADRTPGAI